MHNKEQMAARPEDLPPQAWMRKAHPEDLPPQAWHHPFEGRNVHGHVEEHGGDPALAQETPPDADDRRGHPRCRVLLREGLW